MSFSGLNLIVSAKTILSTQERQCSNFYSRLPTDSAEEAHKDFDNLVYQQYRKVNERHGLVLNPEILAIIKEWLLNHILVEDIKYADYVKGAE